MGKGFFNVPTPVNSPVREYKPGTPETESLLNTYKALYKSKVEVPLYIGGKQVRSNDVQEMNPPHEHKHVLGTYHRANKGHVEDAIAAALEAREAWASMPWEQRAAIFLKCAELLEGPYRDRMNAATMLAQSKNVHQAEIDASCELVDFFRFNVQYQSDIYADQPPVSPLGTWNRLEHRPLEGFIYAVSPFNFTSIAANLPAAPALMGNVVVWKPSDSQMYSAQVIMDLFEEAGVPAGVINMVNGEPEMVTETVLAHKEFSGLHFTGSTHVFKDIWAKIGANIHNYKTYPRIVGETGGKDFVVVHPSSNVDIVATALTRGAFEFSGQKCSAASRAYVPKSLWNDVLTKMKEQTGTMKMGSPEDTNNFINAVIHEGSFDKLAHFIDRAKEASDADVVIGGGYDKSVGYFVEPTVIATSNPYYETMETELFGPVLTIHIYEDATWSEMLKIVDNTSEYALTGAIISQDRYAITEATKALENCAGNFYINDKPTGAVVGQQPFGGARSSGTNDKAGSALNLLRWVSPRTIKETLVSPKDYKYPFLG